MPGSQRLQDWINGGETRRFAGQRIFVRTAVTPDRPPLLLIHGYPTAFQRECRWFQPRKRKEAL